MSRSLHRSVSFLILFFLVVVSATGVGSRAAAQSEGDIWGAPVNLSHSGAASAPVVLAGPDGALQVFWWDQFDGLTTAHYDGAAWSAAASAPILVTAVVGEGLVSTPLEAMPQIVADGRGRAHAWWLGEADRETGVRPLMHSRLAIGATTWSGPDAVAESALTWQMVAGSDGVLHLVYLRTMQSDAYPAGVYYKRSSDGGASWSAVRVLYSSIYFRLLAAEQAHMWVAADGAGQVYVIWDDPRLGRSFHARSTDNGQSWAEPAAVGDPDAGAIHARIGAGPAGEALLLWEASQVAAPCALYQQRSSDGGATWSERQRVLEGLGACGQTPEFLPTAEGDVLLVSGSGSAGLTLAAWDGTQWSQPKGLGFSLEDAELGQQVYLDSLQVALAGDALAAVGRGQDGEIWALQGQVNALEWAFAPPSPWSQPVNLSAGEGWPGLPAVAADAEGRVHVLWSQSPHEGLPGTALVYAQWDGNRWSRPVEVLRSPEGKAGQPALVAVGDRLHAVWSGGLSGEVIYSRAYTRDAYASGGWSEPQILPMAASAGSCPQIAADLGGALHVVYAAPLNEGRGIYYTRSDDGGETWSEARVVFDAAAAGWAMADHPSLAVDERGVIHVAWVRAALPGNGLPEGIYYARSTDRGETWSEPLAVAEGAYDWPLLAASLTGQAHLLWGEADGGAWYQRWSADGGASWTQAERVAGFADVPGPVGLATDGAGTLYLVGLGHDDAGEPALVYSAWAGERWGEPETLRLEAEGDAGPGVAVALQAALGRLDVAFRGEAVGEAGTPQAGVWVAGRTVPAVEVTPLPLFTPQPTATVAVPTPTPVPTPRPAVNPEPPQPGTPVLALGPITLPYTAVGGLLVAALIVVGVVAARSLWGRGR